MIKIFGCNKIKYRVSLSVCSTNFQNYNSLLQGRTKLAKTFLFTTNHIANSGKRGVIKEGDYVSMVSTLAQSFGPRSPT